LAESAGTLRAYIPSVSFKGGPLADIGHRITDAPKQAASRHHLVGIVLAVVLELGWLIHQVAKMG
jgi:hypothetical protein